MAVPKPFGARPLSISVIGIDGVWFIEAWPDSNEMVDQARMWSAPSGEVSVGTDRFV